MGRWRSIKRTEEEALLAALAGRDMDLQELPEEQQNNIRHNSLLETK
jgi:hypothetical protein